MKEEIKKWIKKAKEDLETAKFNYDGRMYSEQEFICNMQWAEGQKKFMMI